MSKIEQVWVEPLDSGYIVTTVAPDERGAGVPYTSAEPTLYGAVTLVARSLGYTGTIEFGPRTVAVPVVDSVDAYAPPGVAFDAEEPPLRAGTAKPGDKL